MVPQMTPILAVIDDFEGRKKKTYCAAKWLSKMYSTCANHMIKQWGFMMIWLNIQGGIGIFRKLDPTMRAFGDMRAGPNSGQLSQLCRLSTSLHISSFANEVFHGPSYHVDPSTVACN